MKTPKWDGLPAIATDFYIQQAADPGPNTDQLTFRLALAQSPSDAHWLTSPSRYAYALCLNNMYLFGGAYGSRTAYPLYGWWWPRRVWINAAPTERCSVCEQPMFMHDNSIAQWKI